MENIQNHFQENKLSQFLSKLLSDKLYEKRKQGALIVEQLGRELGREGDGERISLLIQVLAKEFVYSSLPNSRNGGLIALAGMGIGLGQRVETYLVEIIPPILACLADHDSRVRLAISSVNLASKPYDN
jgi:vacuole morphology and inheritance protein 14